MISIKVQKDDCQLLPLLPVDKAFTDRTSLIINDTTYEICVNVPIVLPKSIIVGFKCFPVITSGFQECLFDWFIDRQSETAKGNNSFKWTKVHTGFSFSPGDGDAGKKLKLVCSPLNGTKYGMPIHVISHCEIVPSPGFCPIVTRHTFTKERAQGFRALTYNLLADCFARSKTSREELYPYCPPHALGSDYRKAMFTSEIVGYNADVMCLQEVDLKIFSKHLKPILNALGFYGEMKAKGNAPEGTAIFFAQDKFKLIAREHIQLGEYFSASPLMKELYRKISKSEALKKRIENRQTSLEAVVLENLEDPTQRVLVATTHLFWHPKGHHIRLFQTAICLKFMEEFLHKHTVNDKRPAVVFAGDFNAYPKSAAADFLVQGFTSHDHEDWLKGGEEEYVNGIKLEHSLNLTSACGYPEFTNYTMAFKDCLDYILVSDDLEVEHCHYPVKRN